MNEIEVRMRLTLGAFTLDAAFAAPGRGVTAIFGPSGSGKTSLLRGIAGLARAQSAKISIGEECWQDDATGRFVPAHRRAIGYVFQEPSLFAHLSVQDNLAYGLKRAPASERRITFQQAVEWLGLERLLARGPRHLSGGERQRVAIARALLANPRLLLMDEPLAALDDAAKSDIVPYLERLHRELSIPLLYVSHAVEEVSRLCDYIVLMENGSVRAHGPLAELLTRLDLPLARGDAAGAIIEATVTERDERFHLMTLTFDGGRLAVAGDHARVGARVRVRVQARDVSVALVPPERSSVLNVLPGRVLDIADDSAGSVMLRLAVGNVALLARLTRKSAAVLGLAGEMPVYVQIKGVALLR